MILKKRKDCINRMCIFCYSSPYLLILSPQFVPLSLSSSLLLALSPLPPFRSPHLFLPFQLQCCGTCRHFRRDRQGQGFGKHVKEGNSHISKKRERERERERSGRRGRDNESSSDASSQTIFCSQGRLLSRLLSLSLSLSTLFPPHLGSPVRQVDPQGGVELANHVVIGTSHPRPIDSLKKEGRGNGEETGKGRRAGERKGREG